MCLCGLILVLVTVFCAAVSSSELVTAVEDSTRSLTLDTIVDAFQGCYKDGTNGIRDCRYFTALQIVLRLLFPLAFFLQMN